MYIIVFYDNRTVFSERLMFIEKAVKYNTGNRYLRDTYQKILLVFSSGFSERFKINARQPLDALIPVITYLPRIRNRTRLNAHLSFLSVTRSDYHNKIPLPGGLSAEDEARYLKVFFDFMKVYPRIEHWKGPLFYALLETAYTIVKNSSGETIRFLKGRFDAICGSKSKHPQYWGTFENASYYRLLSEYISASLSISELKEVCDFCLLLLTLTLWYGQGALMQKTIRRTIERFRNKYKDAELLRRAAIFLLPIDFAFIPEDAFGIKYHNEYNSILKKMRAINPLTEVQPLGADLVWIRDRFAWLDESYQLFLQPNRQRIADSQHKGGLYEGGSIIAATSLGKFILVSRDVVGADLAIANFILEMKQNNTRVYSLPGGFSWSRNTHTNEDVLLDSMHIDTVINAVPGSCTVDGRVKIIVDPYYYEMIKEDPEFKRLQTEQNISGEDIVVIDKKEAYLNLANFSKVIDHAGSQKILFNKDSGLTLPRLKLKKKGFVQTDVEIINISAFNGNIRCVTNMCPRSQIKRGNSLLISVMQSVPKQTEAAIMILFINKRSLLMTLSKAWVASLQVRYYSKESSYEFDDLSQTISINLGREKIYNPRHACLFIEQCIKRACLEIRKRMGIPSGEGLPDSLETLAPISSVPQTGYFIRRRTGQLLNIDSLELSNI